MNSVFLSDLNLALKLQTYMAEFENAMAVGDFGRAARYTEMAKAVATALLAELTGRSGPGNC